jgi:hypothetical protein
MKKLAHHYAKKEKQTSEDVKELSKIHFRNVYKVYSGFTKFLKNQVEQKDRMVDSLFIGHFYK